MIMWEVATRLTPYEGADPNVIAVLVQRGEREKFTTACPEGYIDLAKQCWAPWPYWRPEIDQILRRINIIQQNFNVCKKIMIRRCFMCFIDLFLCRKVVDSCKKGIRVLVWVST
jgi:hypothetical protein